MPKKPSKLRKSINIILAVSIFVASLPVYESFSKFVWAGVIVIFVFALMNLLLIRKTAQSGTDYLPLILPMIYLVSFFGSAASVSSSGMKILLALGAVFLFYVYQIYFPNVPPLLVVETAWAILFMPVYFLTAAVVSFSAFYLMYVLSSLYFADRLTGKKVYFHTGLVLLFLLLSFIIIPWKRL